jgi:hypothetical protein
MPLLNFFNKDEKDNTGGYLASAAALAALPASEYAAGVLSTSAADYAGQELASINPVSYRNANLLKSKILKDPTLAKDLPILMGSSESALIHPNIKSQYIPEVDLKTIQEAIKKNPKMVLRGIGGDDLPMSEFIKRVRNTGGFVNLNDKATLVELAHELGHARVLSPNSSRASTLGLHKLVQNIGRYNPMGRVLAAGAASAATAMQDDPTSPMIYAPAAVLAATQIPVLREEYIASSKGYNALKELESSGALKKGISDIARNHYAKALGTYGAVAAGLTAVPLLTALAKKRFNTSTNSDRSETSNTGLSIGKALGIGAGGALAGLGMYKLAPKALDYVAKPARDFLDELIEKKMAKGEVVDDAVKALKDKAVISSAKPEIKSLPYQSPPQVYYPQPPPPPYPYPYPY